MRGRTFYLWRGNIFCRVCSVMENFHYSKKLKDFSGRQTRKWRRGAKRTGFFFSPLFYLAVFASALVRGPTPCSPSDFQALLTICVNSARVTRGARALRYGFNRGRCSSLFIYRVAYNWASDGKTTIWSTVGVTGETAGGDNVTPFFPVYTHPPLGGTLRWTYRPRCTRRGRPRLPIV